MKKLMLLATLSPALLAQTIPTPPIITGSSSAQGQTTLTVNLPNCQWGNTSCGLSDCGCWEQVWRASCTSASSCPAPVKTSPFIQPSNVSISNTGSNSGAGTTGMVILDTDPLLTAGSFWVYFVTSNFAQDPNTTIGVPSNTAAITVPGSNVVAKFSIKLQYDNPACITGNTCNAEVWRANCTTVTTCPTFNTSTFQKLNASTTQTVTATNTHFTSVDTNSGLAYNSFYAYAVRNAFAANPSSLGGAQQVTVTTPTGVHTAVVNWSSSSCRTASPCTLQVYRATCTSASSCPAYTVGSSAWKVLNMSTGLSSSVGSQSTIWTYTDNDAALVGSTTYAWIATTSYSGAGTVSPASSAFIGTTGVGKTVIDVNLSKKETK